jgi:FKBP-type peptidyl-prolyl cis-trans isomerase
VATTRAQRIGIWIIAAVLTVGTIGSFVAIVLQNENQSSEQARYESLLAEYQKQTEDQAKALSDQYYDELNQHSSRVASFDKAAVTELGKVDLKVGDGEEIAADSTFTAYYIGWNPDGKTFDSSIDGDSLKAPFSVTPGAVITGWTEGAVGMKVGGIRELTIPADLAYGETGSGSDILPNTPIKFVIFIIPTPEPIVPSEELLELYPKYGV